MTTSIAGSGSTFGATGLAWISLLTGLLLWGNFHAEFDSLLIAWTTQEEYSHGILIPFIALFLIYQKKNELELMPFTGSWVGVGLLLFGALLHVAGRLAVVSTLGQYALIICIAALLLAFMGWRAFKVIWVAVLMLVFMVKLPTFIFNNMSSQLQLISSQIGVWFIRLFDISVYLEGNVIDLGAMKLQVVEACSGLRYLFPLMALSLILAVFYKASWWQKKLLFLSSMPVTVLMNSFRIGAIGVTVEYWGQKMAEGFLHDFEGWVVFMAAFVVLIVEVLLLSRLTGDRRPLTEILSLELPAPTDPALPRRQRTIPKPFYVALALLAGFVTLNQLTNVGESVFPQRESLERFPLVLDNRLGTRSYLEGIYLKELQVDDYFVADYKTAGSRPINLYIAYYDVQAEGAGTIHSPRSCLPGSGWQINSLQQETLSGVTLSGVPLTVNKALISKGNNQVLVYYWMQQRGRIITSEWMAKWWIFWDRITRQRSDGALVRVMMELENANDLAAADIKMQRFMAAFTPELHRYIPD